MHSMGCLRLDCGVLLSLQAAWAQPAFMSHTGVFMHVSLQAPPVPQRSL